MEKIKPNHQCLTVQNVHIGRKKRFKKNMNLKFLKKKEVERIFSNLYDEIDIPMKMDEKNRRNFVCKRCGLYATREQVSDIRYKLNQKERTRDDKHDDYLEWWSKSKKEKAEN